MKQCSNCQKEINDNTVKCEYCGKVFNKAVIDTLDTERTLVTLGNNSHPINYENPNTLGVAPTLADAAIHQLNDSLGSRQTMAGLDASTDFKTRYEILETLGSGGMGLVCKARDCRLGRIVAIKRLHTNIAGNQLAISRFLNEAQAIAKLNHYNIVHIYDVSQDSRGPYISMEFIEGKTLTELVRSEGKLSPERSIDIFEQVLAAIAFAHEKGVVHRDIKPGNIMIDNKGVPKLMDFGLAQTREHQNVTLTGALVGTPDYASPEQLTDSKNVDARTDIYSLGATMYECITGIAPRHFRETNLPLCFQELVRKSMEPDIEKRYQTADQMRKALQEVSHAYVEKKTCQNEAQGFAFPGIKSAMEKVVATFEFINHDFICDISRVTENITLVQVVSPGIAGNEHGSVSTFGLVIYLTFPQEDRDKFAKFMDFSESRLFKKTYFDDIPCFAMNFGSDSTGASIMLSRILVEVYGYSKEDGFQCDIHDEGPRNQENNKRCFVATAVFGTPCNRNITLLRQFRSQILQTTIIGKCFIQLYNKIGPHAASFINGRPVFKKMARAIIYSLIVVIVKPLLRVKKRIF